MKTEDNNEWSCTVNDTGRQHIIHENLSSSLSKLTETFLLSLSATGLCYYFYYLLSPWIWSQNFHFNPEDITPLMQISVAQEGVEVYALYILLFVDIAITFVVTEIFRQIAGKHQRQLIIVLCAVGAIIYSATIGFIPPMNSFNNTPISLVITQSLLIISVCFSLIAFLFYLHRYSNKLGLVLTAILLAPVCFIATSSNSLLDYYFIIAPASRLLNGSAISDIYFRYDLLLSLLAAAWMKLDFDMYTFQVLGQASYYLAIMVLYIFSGRLFQKKELSIFLLIALVLGRLYTSPWDNCLCFQVTPLRLDLWLPLLLIVYRWGPYHWSAGLYCGLLALFHKNFGTIYSIAYIQLLVTMCFFSYIDGDRKSSVRLFLKEYGKRCSIPVVIIMLFNITSYFLFQNKEYGNYNSYFLKLGIDFIKIARDSFYWYVPSLLSMVAILLIKLRKNVTVPYLTTGVLLTYCAIGNSIYFFGRSHEHNIINMSIILLFLFFFLLDLITRYLKENTLASAPFITFVSRYFVTSLASLFIVAIIISYSGNIMSKTATQITNISEGKLIYPFNYVRDPKFDIYMNQIRALTDYSPKVYFIDNLDFFYYYYGGYDPVGFCSPFISWIFKKDQNRFLQGLIDKGYYLIATKNLNYVLDDLHYGNHVDIGTHVIVSKLIIQTPKP
jgi:hypothetical protein